MAKILAIGAHPDDIEFYAGGTLAQKAHDGDEIVFVVATDGRNGNFNGTAPEQIVTVRRNEQERAAREIGVKKVLHLGFEDGSLEDNIKKLKERLLQILLTERPEIVFTFDPQKQYIVHDDFHPDHRVLSVAALDVILIDSTLPVKVGTPLKRPEIFLYNVYKVNTKVDISKYLAHKKAAILAFESQGLRLSNACFEKFRVYTSK